jgi:hypothetical protein
MQKRQESKVKMARATLGILTGNEEIVTGTPGLGDATETLMGLVEETAFFSQGQMNTGAEFTTLKNEARTALTVATLKVCSALAAHATVSADPAVKLLKAKYQVADTDVTKLRDMPLFTYANMVFADATPLAELLAPFAVGEDVAGLKTLADNFNALLPQKRTQQSKTSLSTQNLEEAIARIDVLLNDTIDVLVKPWEYIEPDFFRAYTNARIIVDAASRKSNGGSPEPPANPV